jgi:hypothetical protein
MNFDLNIDNYTRDELLQMFELPPNFDRNILEIKEVKLRDSIVNNKEINNDTKVKTMNFLTNAKNVILNNLTDKIEDLKNIFANSYNTTFDLKTTAIEEPSEHMVQVRNERPFVQSFPSEFFPGTINPIRKRTIKKILILIPDLEITIILAHLPILISICHLYLITHYKCSYLQLNYQQLIMLYLNNMEIIFLI